MFPFLGFRYFSNFSLRKVSNGERKYGGQCALGLGRDPIGGPRNL